MKVPNCPACLRPMILMNIWRCDRGCSSKLLVEPAARADNSAAMDAVAEISRNYAMAQTSWEFYDWYGTNRQRLNAALAQWHP